jgi:hypothetical protein
MLNQNMVLEYVKDNLSFPFMQLEFTDEQILDYMKKYTLREFSRYFPDKKQMGLNLQLPATQVQGFQNRYYIFEPEGIEVLNVSEVIMPMSAEILFGHPYRGVISAWETPSFILDTEMARTAKKWSDYNYTFHFHPPNILEILPIPRNATVSIVLYERMQPENLEFIPMDVMQPFLDLCLSKEMIRIGRIRRKYSNMKTPFGDIEVNADALYEEGKELYRETIDKLEKGSLPNVTISFG